MVLWSVDTKDYSDPGSAKIAYTALSGARGGSIVLLHDGPVARPELLVALPRIVHKLRSEGYRLVTVPTLVADDPPPRNQPPPRALSGG